jgi:hypothetical protein
MSLLENVVSMEIKDRRHEGRVFLSFYFVLFVWWFFFLKKRRLRSGEFSLFLWLCLSFSVDYMTVIIRYSPGRRALSLVIHRRVGGEDPDSQATREEKLVIGTSSLTHCS